MSKENLIVENNEKDETGFCPSSQNEIRRSAFQKNVDNIVISNITVEADNLFKLEEKLSKTCFEISKQSKVPTFEKLKNYYIEYWSVFKKNEVVLAKIKETSLEINCMKAHLDELKALDIKKNNSSN